MRIDITVNVIFIHVNFVSKIIFVLFFVTSSVLMSPKKVTPAISARNLYHSFHMYVWNKRSKQVNIFTENTKYSLLNNYLSFHWSENVLQEVRHLIPSQ